MREILEIIADIRGRLKEHGDWFDSVEPGLPNAFNTVFNHITLILELLSHYYRIWSRAPPYVDEAKIMRMRRENAERVLEITKWAFISALSSMEYALKELLKASDRAVSIQQLQRLRRKLLEGKKVYLRNIVKSCRAVGIIDDEQYKVWECLIEVRNAVVHNNAVADKDAEYRIGNFTVTFSKGETLKGRLDFFVKLLQVAVEHYNKLLQALLA